MQTQPAAQSSTAEAPQRHGVPDRSEPQPATAPSAAALPEAGIPSGRETRTTAATAQPRPRETNGLPTPPPYEAPDYEKYRYGYPPFSGRMFGSGN